MKKLILILLSFVAFNLSAQEKIAVKKEIANNQEKKLTQVNNNAKTLAKTETKKLTQQLDLSTEQQGRVFDIYLNYFEEEIKSKEKTKQLIKSKNEGNKGEIKQKIAKQKNSNKEVLNSKLKEVLTAEQFKNYQKKNTTKLKIAEKKLRSKN